MELMVAVGIIGIMSSFAVPKYQKFKANAAQSEAQATLSSIYTLQQLFYTENDRYAKMDINYDGTTRNLKSGYKASDELLFVPSGNARYKYTGGLATADNGAPGNNGEGAVKFKAVADSQTPLGSCVGETPQYQADGVTVDTTKPALKNEDIWCIN